MAVREVVKQGDDLLRKRSKEVVDFDRKLAELLDDMWDTMYANDGMGLAGPQVGMLKRVVVMDVNGMKLELVNPEILSQKGKDIEEEGCLSCGKFRAKVERPMTVTVRAYDRLGYEFTITGEKYLARCLCHEIDHLNGILFVDKIIKE